MQSQKEASIVNEIHRVLILKPAQAESQAAILPQNPSSLAQLLPGKPDCYSK